MSAARLDAERSAADIRAALEARGDPARAVAERAYLKSDVVHFGTSVPQMRSVVRAFLREHRDLDHDRLLAVCHALWPVAAGAVVAHEPRMAAVELLDARQRLLTIDDVPAIEAWIRAAKTWALVDTLAGHVAAGLVVADPAMSDVLDRWVGDDDFWVRRSALLALMRALREGRELDRFFAYADALLDEREFFIRKAIGWVARDLSRREPEAVSAWVRRNLARMNGVTMREAVKYLPDGGELLAEWKAGTRSPAQPRRRKSVG